MTPWTHLRAAAFTLLLTFAICPLSAAKLDLDRVTPVADTEQIPVFDFFRPPLLRDPKLNTLGTHVGAIVSPSVDHTELMVYDLKSQKIERVGTRGNSDIYAMDWLDGKRLMYRISTQKLGGIGLFAGEAGKLTSSYPLVQYVGSSLITVPVTDRTHPLVRLHSNSLNTGLYAEVVTLRSDIDTGEIVDLANRPADGVGLDTMKENNNRHILIRHPVLESIEDFDFRYIADKDGKLAFGLRYGESGDMALHRLADGKWRESPLDLEEIVVVDTGDKPGEIVAVAPRRDGKPRPLQIADAASGEFGEVLLQDKAYDFDGWLYRDPVSHLIVGAAFNRSGPAMVWFTEAYRDLQKLLDAKFPGMIVRITGLDDAGKVVLVTTFSDRQPAAYHWFDLEHRTGGLLKSSAPWLDPKRMQPMSVIKYKTRDGKQLDAYVTMPAGATKQNPPPLVVLPHGGGRDTWGFDSEVQFLASRGYAVLRPNYRSSAGYNWMFPKEDEWDFRKQADDVIDATKALIASGLVDAKRVGIMGTDFGGYLALCGAAFEPSVFRCSVAVSPNYDWGKYIEEYKDTKYSDPFYLRMKFKLGDTRTNAAKFEAIAPLRSADKIRGAVLVCHGEYDSTLRIGHGKQLLSAVERSGFPTEFVLLRNEAGTPQRLDNRVELYTRIEAFLAKNLAGR